MAIYIRLKELREAKGLTQYALASAIGMQVNAVQKIEYQQNKSIPYATLEKLCKALDCAPGDLLVIADNQEVSKN